MQKKAMEPKGLKDEISQFKKKRIQEEACHLFYELGYERTTIEAIADQLDVTKPFIYGYYKNKSQLLYEICQTGITLSLEAFDRIDGGKESPSDKLIQLVTEVTDIVIGYQEYIVVYGREEKNLDSAEARSIRQQRSLFDHRLSKLLEIGVESGEFFIDDLGLTAKTISGVLSWVSFWYIPGGKWTSLDITNHILEMVLSLLYVDHRQKNVAKITAIDGGIG
ncbi:MAG: TetR/AcrR family transcriptional regulator [Halieaceae bacterium]|nr:TetR/AcrR family transcriptional regulator [Halieaceae bacterium]